MIKWQVDKFKDVGEITKLHNCKLLDTNLAWQSDWLNDRIITKTLISLIWTIQKEGKNGLDCYANKFWLFFIEVSRYLKEFNIATNTSVIEKWATAIQFWTFNHFQALHTPEVEGCCLIRILTVNWAPNTTNSVQSNINTTHFLDSLTIHIWTPNHLHIAMTNKYKLSSHFLNGQGTSAIFA